MRLRLEIVLLILSLPLLLRPVLPVVAPWMGTNVAFQSSDGGWSDGEVLVKGRDFSDVVALFRSYRTRCARPDSELERTTEKPSPSSLSWWFDDYGDPKWRIRLAAPRAERPRLDDVHDCRIPEAASE